MNCKVFVIGLGYVGLPLARLFSTKYPTIGFDINRHRIEQLCLGIDTTLEIDSSILKEAISQHGLRFTADIEEMKSLRYSNDEEGRNVYIVTVPTPIDYKNRPDLTPLIKASETVGLVIGKGDIVVYESTVYPGVTEEECLPVVEAASGLQFNVDFFAGYSPERINPGDKLHTVEKIMKVTSGSTPEIGVVVDQLYASVIAAGTHLAPSIRVAEASKIVENCQRDVQIAFFNELAKIFNVMDIDTHEVIEAAATKWNFVKLKPGLVGGHCISVDPYYLIEKSQVHGYSPNILIQSRAVNDSMGEHVAYQVIRLMNKKGVMVKDARALLLGFTFKENCPDIRNTKIIDIYRVFNEYTSDITIFDPYADPQEVMHEYGVKVLNDLNEASHKEFDVVVLGVSHSEFAQLDIVSLCAPLSVVYDVKSVLPLEEIDGRL